MRSVVTIPGQAQHYREDEQDHADQRYDQVGCLQRPQPLRDRVSEPQLQRNRDQARRALGQRKLPERQMQHAGGRDGGCPASRNEPGHDDNPHPALFDLVFHLQQSPRMNDPLEPAFVKQRRAELPAKPVPHEVAYEHPGIGCDGSLSEIDLPVTSQNPSGDDDHVLTQGDTYPGQQQCHEDRQRTIGTEKVGVDFVHGQAGTNPPRQQCILNRPAVTKEGGQLR